MSRVDNFEKIKTNYLGRQYERYCEDCRYHNPNGFCKHPQKEKCLRNELWTPKKYGLRTRANISTIDEYCGYQPKKSNKLSEPPNKGSNIVTNPVNVLQTSCFPFIKNELIYYNNNEYDEKMFIELTNYVNGQKN